MQEAVHPRDGGGHQIPLLPVKADVAPLLLLPAQMRDARKQHAAGAARRVIDGFARLRFQHLGHQMDDSAVGVELGGSVAGIVRELLDEVFVALAKFVFGQIGNRELKATEMLNQVAQHRVGQAILVRPLRVAEDAIELVGIRRLNGPHRRLQRPAHIVRRLPHITPMRVLRNLEAVVLRVRGEIGIATGLLQRQLASPHRRRRRGA